MESILKSVKAACHIFVREYIIAVTNFLRKHRLQKLAQEKVDNLNGYSR